MTFNWDGFTATDFADYCARVESGTTAYDLDYIGAVRVGELCFDLVVREANDEGTAMFLTYDLYVGGVDTGYGYKKDGYPYDYADGKDFADTCTSMSYEDFKKMCEKEFTEFISIKGKEIREKAEMPLHIW